MCIAYNSISSQIKQLNEELGRLSEDLSHHDKTLSNFYHELESRTFNASEGYYIAKNLQDILFKRRKVKFEICQLKSLKSQLENVELKLKEHERKFIKANPRNWNKLIHI